VLWKCPACSTPIRQQLTAAGHEVPRPGVIYCCTVCHLDLVLDPTADQMTTAPFPGDIPDERPRGQ
jgi:hypothetical protein